MQDFDRLAPEIERALVFTGGAYRLDDVRVAVERGDMQLWPGRRSVIVTRLVEHPRLRELWFFLAAGDMDEIRDLYPIVLQWGEAQGCQRAAFLGRPGWERSFLTRDAGWRASATMYEKEPLHG